MKGYRPPYDEEKYVQYYLNRAGSGLPGYAGSSTQYGAGIGGIFRSLFRMAVPLLKRGVSIAKPHLKNAAKNIFRDVVSNIVRTASTPKQQGSGMTAYVKTPARCPPSGKRRAQVSKEGRKQNKTASVCRKRAKPKRIRKRTNRHYGTVADNIFI